MKGLTTPDNLFARYKKWWIIGAGLLIVLLVAGFVGWSFYAWQDYSKQYVTWHDTLKKNAGDTLGLKATTTDEKAKKLTAMENLRDNTREGNEYCSAHSWLHWQQFIGEVKTRIEHCQQLVADTDGFARDLGAVTDYLRGEVKITAILRDVASGGEADESSWKALADKWSKAHETIGKLSLPKNLQQTQKIASDKAATIHSAWLSLIAASDAKDRQKYEAAVDQIDTTYGGLDQIIQASQKTLQPLADTLANSHKRVFLKA